MKKYFALTTAGLFAVFLLGACSSDDNNTSASSSTTTASSAVSSEAASYQDGEYRAEASEYANGYKEYVVLTIAGGKITSAEFNALNEAGELKTSDTEYKEKMEAQNGTYPEEYMTKLTEELVTQQNTADVEAVTGASHSSSDFKLLADAALANAKNGDTETAVVELPTE